MRHQRSSRAISAHLSTTCVTSGSAITPTFLTSPSPIDRDIASPMRPCAQTRAGRPPLRSETVPPRASMRARSAGKSGLWSWQRSCARHEQHRRPSERPSERSSEVIRCHQRSSEVIRRALGEVIRGHQWSSEVIRGHLWSSEVIRGHRRPSEVISAAHLRDDLSAHAPPEDGARVARTRRPAVGAVQVQYRRGSAARHRRPS